MQFLNSKDVQLLERSFSMILTGQVKEGEITLKNLRVNLNYERLLANLISSSNDSYSKMLAILELKKIHHLQDEQSIWALKNAYFKEDERMAESIRQICTSSHNIELSIDEFLNLDPSALGFFEIKRLLDFVLGLLKQEYHLKCLFSSTRKIATILQTAFECFNETEIIDMTIICLGMFVDNRYDRLNESAIHAEVNQFYNIFSQKIEVWGRGSFTESSKAIAILLKSQYFGENVSMEIDLIKYFSEILRCLEFASIHLPFQRESLRMVARRWDSLNQKNPHIAFQFLNVYYEWNKQWIIYNKFQVDQSVSAEESQFREYLDQFIFHYFKTHQTLFKQFNLTQNAAFQMALLNIFEKQYMFSCDLTKKLIALAPSLLHDWYKSAKDQDFLQEKLADLMILIRFLRIFKECVAKQNILQVCMLIDTIGFDHFQASQTCYNFLEDVWEELTMQSTPELQIFLDHHLQRLVSNQWSTAIENYGCLIRVLEYLQNTTQFIENLESNDSLLQNCTKAAAIIQNLITDKQIAVKMKNENIHLICIFLSTLSSNHLFQNTFKLRKPFLDTIVQLIFNRQCFSKESAKLYALYLVGEEQIYQEFVKLTSEDSWQLFCKEDYPFYVQTFVSCLSQSAGQVSSTEQEQFGCKFIKRLKQMIEIGTDGKVRQEICMILDESHLKYYSSKLKEMFEWRRKGETILMEEERCVFDEERRQMGYK